MQTLVWLDAIITLDVFMKASWVDFDSCMFLSSHVKADFHDTSRCSTSDSSDNFHMWQIHKFTILVHRQKIKKKQCTICSKYIHNVLLLPNSKIHVTFILMVASSFDHLLGIRPKLEGEHILLIVCASALSKYFIRNH